jgi:hypothetical protein
VYFPSNLPLNQVFFVANPWLLENLCGYRHLNRPTGHGSPPLLTVVSLLPLMVLPTELVVNKELLSEQVKG